MPVQVPTIVQSVFTRVDNALSATLSLPYACVTGNSTLLMGLGGDSFFPVRTQVPPGPPWATWVGLAFDYSIAPYGTFGQVLSWSHLVADGDDSQHVEVVTFSRLWPAISWGLFEITGDIRLATITTSILPDVYGGHSHDPNCWNPSASYSVGNVVSWIAYSWTCTVPNIDQEPYAGSSYWARGGSSASTTLATAEISNPGESLCIGGFTWKSADTSTNPSPSPYVWVNRSNGDPAGDNSIFFAATGNPLPDTAVSVTLPNAAHWVTGWVLISVYSSSTTVITSNSPSISGTSVTFTATVTTTQGGDPTGTVTFSDSLGSFSPQTVPLSGGQAQFSTSALSVDSHTITAAYNGDSSHASSLGTVAQSVQYATPSVAVLSSLNPSLTGDPVTFTVNVTGGYGTPTGSVLLSDDLGSFSPQTLPLVLGSAQYTAPSLGLDYHNISAAYSGDGVYAPLAAVLVQQVVPKYDPVVAMTSSNDPQSFGQEFTLTITVGPSSGGPVPTGTVGLTDTVLGDLGTYPLVSGAATYTMDLLSPWAVGSHIVTAAYGGDSSYNTGTASLVELITVASSLVYADLPGFALVASYSPEGDEGLPAWASFSASPDPADQGQEVYLLWTSANIASVRIYGSNGTDSLDTGVLQASGPGLYAVASGFQHSITLSCLAYDASGNTVASQPLTVTVISAPELDSLSPPSATEGSTAQTLDLMGSYFTPDCTATYNGTPHTVSYIGPTELSIPLTDGDQATQGSYPVVVTNSIGSSDPVDFLVTSVSPYPDLPPFVQSNMAGSPQVPNPVTVPYLQDTTNGNFLLCFVASQDASAPPISDTLGSPWTLVGSHHGLGSNYPYAYVFAVYNSDTYGGPDTVQVGASDGVPRMVQIWEFQVGYALDTITWNDTAVNGSGSVSTGTTTMTHDYDLVLTLFVDEDQGARTVPIPGTSFQGWSGQEYQAPSPAGSMQVFEPCPGTTIGSCGDAPHFLTAWQAGKQYYAGNEVVDAGSHWLCAYDNIGSEPSIVNPNWQLVGSGSGVYSDERTVSGLSGTANFVSAIIAFRPFFV